MAYQPRQYDPTHASWGKVLTEWRYEPELGDYVKVVNYEIPQDGTFLGLAEDPHPTGVSIIGQRIINERNSNKVRVEELQYPNRIGVLPGDDENGSAVFPPYWEETRNVEELQEFVDRTIITSKLVPREAGGLEEEAYATWHFREELRQYGPNHRKLTTWGPYGDEYLTRVSYDTDPTTGLRIRVTRSVIYGIPTVSTAPLPGVSYFYKQVSAGVWVAEERQLLQADGVSPIVGMGTLAFASYQYHTRMSFVFPTYIRAFNPARDIIRTLNKQQRRTIVDLRIRTRKEFSANVWAKKVVSYHAYDPVGPDLAVPGEPIFEWRYVDWKHDGALFRVNVERTIADETPIDITSLMNDTFYGPYVESVIFPASPGVTTLLYEEAIGYMKLIDIDVQQIENRIFRMVKTYVKME